jgi:hypothetical protein
MKKLHRYIHFTIFLLLSCSALLGSNIQENEFGVDLPIGIKAKNIIQLIAPKVDPNLVTLVGMKKWPHKENTYLAIICLSRSKEDFSDDTSYCSQKQCCNSGYSGTEESERPKIVYLSMLEFKDTLKLIASYPSPLNVRTTWKDSNIESPDGDKNSYLSPGSYDKFDFANYKISDTQTAFGIRVGWRTMYSGGGGYFSALLLFKVDGNKIVNILSEPMAESGIAGSGPENKNSYNSRFKKCGIFRLESISSHPTFV